MNKWHYIANWLLKVLAAVIASSAHFAKGNELMGSDSQKVCVMSTSRLCGSDCSEEKGSADADFSDEKKLSLKFVSFDNEVFNILPKLNRDHEVDYEMFIMGAPIGIIRKKTRVMSQNKREVMYEVVVLEDYYHGGTNPLRGVMNLDSIQGRFLKCLMELVYDAGENEKKLSCV